MNIAQFCKFFAGASNGSFVRSLVICEWARLNRVYVLHIVLTNRSGKACNPHPGGASDDHPADDGEGERPAFGSTADLRQSLDRQESGDASGGGEERADGKADGDGLDLGEDDLADETR